MRSRRFTGSARVLRGVVLGSMLFVLTVGGHMAGGGGHSLTNAACLLPVMILLSSVLADRRRSLAWLVSYLLAAEVLFHVVLTVSLGHNGKATSVAPSGVMIAAHVVAAGLVALAIHHADALLEGWLRFLDAVTRGCRLWVAALEPAAFVLPMSSGFAIASHREARWRTLRAPPVVLA